MKPSLDPGVVCGFVVCFFPNKTTPCCFVSGQMMERKWIFHCFSEEGITGRPKLFIELWIFQSLLRQISSWNLYQQPQSVQNTSLTHLHFTGYFQMYKVWLELFKMKNTTLKEKCNGQNTFVMSLKRDRDDSDSSNSVKSQLLLLIAPNFLSGAGNWNNLPSGTCEVSAIN